MNLPPDVKIIEKSRVFIWQPKGVMDEAKVNKILAFLVEQEGKFGRDFDRFTDTSALQGIELTFKYVFHVALYRRLSWAGREAVKSAFLVTDPEVSRHVKLHAIMTDHSPLKVAMFEESEAAARWLGIPVELVTVKD